MHGRIDCRMGTYEQQLQSFIWKLRVQGHLFGILSEEQESGFAGYSYLLMTHKVDKRVPCTRQQPRFRILWHAVSRPSRECFDQRITEGVLGASHVARVRGKVGHQATL